MNEELRVLLSRVRGVAVSATETAGQALGTAGKKANVMWDISRLNVQMGEVKTEIDKLYRDIGALVYQTHIDPATSSEDLPEKLEELSLLHKKIENLERKVDVLKSKTLCPVCKQPMEKSDAFCRVCGHAVRREPVPVTVEATVVEPAESKADAATESDASQE